MLISISTHYFLNDVFNLLSEIAHSPEKYIVRILSLVILISISLGLPKSIKEHGFIFGLLRGAVWGILRVALFPFKILGSIMKGLFVFLWKIIIILYWFCVIVLIICRIFDPDYQEYEASKMLMILTIIGIVVVIIEALIYSIKSVRSGGQAVDGLSTLFTHYGELVRDSLSAILEILLFPFKVLFSRDDSTKDESKEKYFNSQDESKEKYEFYANFDRMGRYTTGQIRVEGDRITEAWIGTDYYNCYSIDQRPNDVVYFGRDLYRLVRQGTSGKFYDIEYVKTV